MHFTLKLLLSNLVILSCVWLGRKFPSFAGLIATMPLTSMVVLLWLYHDNPSAKGELSAYVGGVFFGVLPTLCFFGVVWLCLLREVSLPIALAAGSVVWLGAAFVHQLLLR